MSSASAAAAAYDATIHTGSPDGRDVERAEQDVAAAEGRLQSLRDKAVKFQEHLTATISAVPAAERELEDARARLAALTEMED